MLATNWHLLRVRASIWSRKIFFIQFSVKIEQNEGLVLAFCVQNNFSWILSPFFMKFWIFIEKVKTNSWSRDQFYLHIDALKMKISASTYFLKYWSYSNARQPRHRSSSVYQPRCHFLNLVVDTVLGRWSTKPTQFHSEMEQKTRQKLSQNIIGLYCSN
jgi:hypothetical protein